MDDVGKHYDMKSEHGLKKFLVHNMIMTLCEEVVAAVTTNKDESSTKMMLFKILSSAVGGKLKDMIGEKRAQKFIDEKEKLLSMENIMAGTEEVAPAPEVLPHESRVRGIGQN